MPISSWLKVKSVSSVDMDVFGFSVDGFEVVEYWQDGMRLRVSDAQDRFVLIGPPGSEPGWPDASAADLWASRSVKALVYLGLPREVAARLLSDAFGWPLDVFLEEGNFFRSVMH